MENLKNKKQGVALIFTLSIVLILSLAVSEVIESTATEIKLLGNSQNQFQVESRARSAFRAVMFALKKNGANQLFRSFQKIPEGIPMQLEDSTISAPKMYSMDHYLWIGFAEKSPRNTQKTFAQITEGRLTRLMKTGENDYVDPYEVKNAVGHLIGWLKGDSNLAIDYPGADGYITTTKEPAPQVKKALFDIPSEIKALEPFQKSDLISSHPSDKAGFQFRMQELNGFGEPSVCDNFVRGLNVNLIPTDQINNEIQKFVENLEEVNVDNGGLCEKRKSEILESWEDIAKGLEEHFKETKSLQTVDTQIWNDILRSVSDNLSSDTMKDLLNIRSELISIRFRIQTGGVSKEVTAHIKMIYPDGKDTDIPKQLEIHYFQIQ